MSHELDSALILIHPPLAIAGYVFIFLFTVSLFVSQCRHNRRTALLGIISWLLIALGLVTGMIWAQFAWGSYWTWDPKETLTLSLFIICSLSVMAYYEKKMNIARLSATFACVFCLITFASSFITIGLHSFI